MANIVISDLDTAGLDLFTDSEGFMSELTEEELANNYGGITPVVITGVAVNTWYVVGGAALGAAGAIAEAFID